MEMEMGQGPEVARRVGHRLWMCAAWRYTGYGHLTLTLTPTLTLTLTPTLTLTLTPTLTPNQVRAMARRGADGQPVGLLLLQASKCSRCRHSRSTHSRCAHSRQSHSKAVGLLLL